MLENASRLADEPNRVLLLEFLCTELQACRMAAAKHGSDSLMDTTEDSVGAVDEGRCRALQSTHS